MKSKYIRQYKQLLRSLSAQAEASQLLKERIAKLATIAHLPEGQRAFIISHNLI